MKTFLAGLELAYPLVNAAGLCKSEEEVTAFSKAHIGALVHGSITSLPRAGNEGEYFAAIPGGSLNSKGMPNRGADFYREALPAMIAQAHAHNKIFISNVAGFSPSEYRELAHLAWDAGADAVELNLGCPNVWHSGQQKTIASFSPTLVDTILTEVGKVMTAKQRLGIKVSPYSDPSLLAEVAKVVSTHKIPVSFVTTTNTFPNAAGYDALGMPLIDAPAGLAGLGGATMKYVSIGQIHQWRQALPASIDIIGIGGVSSGQDMRDLMRAGASVVGLASAYFIGGEDVGIFERIIREYRALASPRSHSWFEQEQA